MQKMARAAIPQISNLDLFVMRHVDSILAITFDHDLQMTRNWYYLKALESHLFQGVLKFWPIRADPARPPSRIEHLDGEVDKIRIISRTRQQFAVNI